MVFIGGFCELDDVRRAVSAMRTIDDFQDRRPSAGRRFRRQTSGAPFPFPRYQEPRHLEKND